MLLRRITEHVRAQNWMAIAIDFLIVVLGVFVATQVSNWNTARAFNAQERAQLAAMRTEIEGDLDRLTKQQVYYSGVSAAGERGLAFLDSGADCGEACWPLLVDLFEASQWIDLGAAQSVYSEMRRVGLPRSPAVNAAVATFYGSNVAINSISNERPAYRLLIRGYIPAAAQQEMWRECHVSTGGGIERFNRDCPAAIPPEVSASAIGTIRDAPAVHAGLTQWTATLAQLLKSMERQKVEANDAIEAINAELGDRQ
jgi:hypothetical protein